MKTMSTPFSPMMKYMQVVKIHGKFSYAFVFKGLDLIYWEHPSQMLRSGLRSEIHSASIIWADSRLKHSTEQSGASGEACYVHFYENKNM